MTTTHTFQGLNTDSKPSSRVLNPPGGSSSNIFGVSDAQPPARTPARTGSDSSSQSSTNVIGQGQNAATAQKSRASRNAFNPITGEPYDQPQPKPQPKQPTSNASETSKTETAMSGTLETAASLSSGTLSGQEQHPATDSAQSEPTGQQPSPPVEQGTASPAAVAVQPGTAPPAAVAVQSGTAPPAAVAVQPGTAPPAAAQQSRNQQSGIFGGSEQVQEQRSTRVSQPPGGRSTKLW